MDAYYVAAQPIWIIFMEKYLSDKPNDKFPKAPGPDKEIVAKRAEAERAMRKAEADEAENAAKGNDDTADKAKSAAQDEGTPKEPGARPAPKMDEVGETPRPPARPSREEHPRNVERTPPPARPEPQAPKKRGKNG